MINIYNAADISLIRESCRLVAKTLIMLESYVKPGVNTLFLDKIAEDFIRSHGAIPAFKGYGGSRNPYPATLCVSINEEVVHGIPGDRVLKDGDIVGIDCGNVLNGFYGDHAKTFAVGEVSPENQELILHTKASLDLGLSKAVAGNRVNDIGHAVQTYIEDKGYSVVRDLVGHGVGKQLHEEPAVPNFGKAGTGPLLKAGMVLAIEPMINRGGWRVKVQRDGWTIVTADKSMSAHFEHTVLVGEQSAEILTMI
ncbi:MAG: type I methionyl aminopeptidase [Bacteroidetes bacterium]|nr:type I methionyl aminopeptidase [Bacteroidota bacterium]